MEFHDIILNHQERYPHMNPQDYGKLAYQSEFGPKHLGLQYDRALKAIEEEWNSMDIRDESFRFEAIGNGYFRCHFWQNATSEEKELVTKLFWLTSRESTGTFSGLKRRLKETVKCNGPEMQTWLNEYEKAGYPVVSHSDLYRAEYHPHYRLIHEKYVNWFSVLWRIQTMLKKEKSIIISIDGDSGSGKTTFAHIVQTVFGGNIFHMDDYYLPISERKENWGSIPAGNMDIERFLKDVVKPAKQGTSIVYRPYDCQKRDYSDSRIVEPDRLTIIEGSYSQHPDLADNYDLKIFLYCDSLVQRKRLLEREGSYFNTFENQWIPMEKRYHSHFKIKEHADLLYDTGGIA